MVYSWAQSAHPTKNDSLSGLRFYERFSIIQMHNLSKLIDVATLLNLLGANAARFDIQALGECESTNSLLLKELETKEFAPHKIRVLTADLQTKGRGTRGRFWHSSPDNSLVFSVAFRFDNFEQISGLSLVIGLAVLQAFENLGIFGGKLKWANDLLFNNQKLGGILIELISHVNTHQNAHQNPHEHNEVSAIIGIGLNLKTPPNIDFHSPKALRAASLADICGEQNLPDRHVLLAALLTDLAAHCDEFVANGFSPFVLRWQTKNAWQNEEVELLLHNQTGKTGKCVGVDETGALLLATKNGIERIISGDVSLRKIGQE